MTPKQVTRTPDIESGVFFVRGIDCRGRRSYAAAARGAGMMGAPSGEDLYVVLHFG